jgi:hypothetical protein
MIARRFLCLIVLGVAVGLVPRVAAQIQTEVPAVIPGAKPVSVERIKIHGQALEGNLEGDAVDREVFVFLPPSFMRCTAIQSGPSSGLTKSTCRRRLKALLPRVPEK